MTLMTLKTSVTSMALWHYGIMANLSCTILCNKKSLAFPQGFFYIE